MVVPDVDDIKALLGESVDCHVLHRYELPACPLLAARAAGTSIDFSSAVKWTGEKAEGCGAAVIEGAGGLLVPLTAEKTMLDFIAAVGYPVILVAPNRLGCINHSLLSIRAMEDRGIHLEALVLNNLRPVEPGEVERANAEMIRIFAPGTRILEVGYGDDFSL
jgi:dethiobiotin synthetase